ncbi:IgG-blocking protein M [Malacoplasma muris]|uniref:IgG-blocking protein M n=1 Tax=Malacoplasma muris TaxID=2119 RepID=UPI00398F1485
MTKYKKLGLLLSGVVASALTVGVAIPLATSAMNNSTSIKQEENNSGSNDQGSNIQKPVDQESVNFTTRQNVAIGENLTFTADVKSISKSNVSLKSASTDETQVGSTKQLTTVSGKKQDYRVTTEFANNRKYMPILAYDENISYNNYSQSRSYSDANKELFPGWDRVEDKNATQGLQTKVKSSDGMYVYKFIANKTLKGAFPNIEDQEITFLVINLQDAGNQTSSTDFKTRFENDLKKIQPQFVSISGVNDWNKSMIPNLSIDKNLKKLTIWDTWDTLTDFSGINIPNSVKELEIRSNSLKNINPLQIPKDTSIIHEMGFGATFNCIDLSSQGKMDDAKLQEAIDLVYKTRIKERAFQSNFAGGYIYQWNLRKTGLTSFNNVTVPMLEDGTGRFYIAYVAIESDAGSSNSTSNETITDGKEPSNDANIGEWFDWNENGWSKVETVIVSAKDGKALDFDKTVKEIIGFINKYPNVKTIYVHSLTFTDTTKKPADLKEAVKQAYTGYPEKIDAITFSDKSPETPVENK